MVKITVDNREIEGENGANLLRTCLLNDVYIPNLCFMERLEHPPASCRLCFVEIDGHDKPVPACQVTVVADMVVRTETPAVRKLQRTALELLLSVHHVDCGHCVANKKCELQKMARFLKMGLKPKRLEKFLKDETIGDDHPFLIHHPNRCVLCGKCIQVCRDSHNTPFMDFADRGFKTLIRFYGQREETGSSCVDCRRCVNTCPVGALTLKTPTDAVAP